MPPFTTLLGRGESRFAFLVELARRLGVIAMGPPRRDSYPPRRAGLSLSLERAVDSRKTHKVDVKKIILGSS